MIVSGGQRDSLNVAIFQRRRPRHRRPLEADH